MYLDSKIASNRQLFIPPAIGVHFKNTTVNKKLQIDFKQFYKKAKALKENASIDGATINLPFISFNLSSENKERNIAREIIIRMRNKRVLNSKECCENCIDNSLESLIEIRKFLVDKQVDIDNLDSPLFLLSDFALYGIKKFLSYTESFNPSKDREKYFDALHIIRGHLLRTFDQICIIAEVPSDFGFRYDLELEWNKDIYMLNE